MTLQISVEHPKFVQPAYSKRPYYSFTLRLFHGDLSIGITGWKYFPDDGGLSTPTQHKGDGKFFNTCNMTPQFYNKVKEIAGAYFGLPENQENKEVTV